ncbi:MAG: S-adenosylmethionine uptake transporter [Rhodobacteraceae bacterium HLUCCA08]|nr:MAG: S-adenosylmethionine uptake transporter [Rhodobacteraceae bacterium HLUCCA08]
MSANVRGAVLALIGFAIFSTHDVVIKVLGESYSPVQIVFFSVLLSFPLATVMLMRDAKPGTLLPVHPWWIALRTAAAVITGLSAFYAFSVLPLAQTYAILFAAPLLITVLAIPILGEVVRLRRWIAVAVGLAGVIVVLRPGATELTLGHAAALAAAVGGAVVSIIARRIGTEERPVVMLLYPMVANFVLMGAALAWVYEPMPVEHLGLLFVISALAWTGSRLILEAYRSGEAAIIAPMQYSQIIWASAFGLIFFGEGIDGATMLGTGIIIASGIYIVLRESRANVSAHRPVLRTRSRPSMGSAPRIGSVLRLSGQHPDQKAEAE